MFNVKNWSVRTQIMVPAVGIPVLVFLFIFVAFYFHEGAQLEEMVVEKAHSICMEAEAAREVAEENWERGLYGSEQLAKWVVEDRMDLVLASIPVVTAWNTVRRSAKEDHYEFYTPKVSPRNPENEPSDIQLRALQTLKSQHIEHYVEINEETNKLHYFTPIRLTESCLMCHGDPRNSLALWGNDKGRDATGAQMEGWKIGEIHGAFEVVQSMAPSQAELATTLWKGLGLFSVGMLVSAFVLMFLTSRIINRTIYDPIRQAVKSLTEGSQQVAAASDEISNSSQHLASGASEQASTLEETSANLEEMTSMTRRNAENAREAQTLAGNTRQAAIEGSSSMEKLSDAMSELSTSSAEMAKIVKTSEAIAFQTNLLALNAAVEAARAGEHGKGFAVVAEEVRNLAQKAAEAARDTGALIESSGASVENGVRVTHKTAEILGTINTVSDKTAALVMEITQASEEQSKGITQLNTSVGEMNGVTQQIAANAEENASAAQQLSAQAESIMDLMQGLGNMVGGSGDTATATHGTARAARPRRSAPAVQHSPVERPRVAPSVSAKNASQREPVLAGGGGKDDLFPMGDEDFGEF